MLLRFLAHWATAIVFSLIQRSQFLALTREIKVPAKSSSDLLLHNQKRDVVGGKNSKRDDKEDSFFTGIVKGDTNFYQTV